METIEDPTQRVKMIGACVDLRRVGESAAGLQRLVKALLTDGELFYIISNEVRFT